MINGDTLAIPFDKSKERDPIGEHKKNLRRVNVGIRDIVLDFCRAYIGRHFFMADLEVYVAKRKRIAPGSAGRILRMLEQEGVVSYDLLSRAESKYRINYINVRRTG